MPEEITIPGYLDIQQVLESYVLPWGINIVMALVIFFIGKSLIKVLVNLARKLMAKAKIDNILINFIASIVSTLLLLFVVIASLDQLGVNTTSLIALVNLASGVMLIIFRPFNDGDFVEAAGVAGVIETISIFTTTMRTGDNREIIIPNGEIFGGTITNYSKRSRRRVDMVFAIGYDDDLKKAKKIINRILKQDKRVLTDPEPSVAVAELADSSVNFNVRPWCKTEDYWDVYSDTHESIKLTFDAEGISIPYPQMDIHQDKAA